MPLTVGFSLGLVLSMICVNVASAQASRVNGLTALQNRHVSGVVSVILDSNAASNQASVGLVPLTAAESNANCGGAKGSNIKVNQDCLNVSDSSLQGRSQAQNETAIAQDPNEPAHMVAAFNDYRRGDGTCGTAWSVDGGASWQDSTLPNGFVYGTAFGGVAREYFHAAGDPSVAWDTKGNAYLNCQM